MPPAMPDGSGSPRSSRSTRTSPPTPSSSAATPTSSTRGSLAGSHRSSHQSGELAAYYDFSKRRSASFAQDEPVGLSGFLEYRKLDGSWRPFLFQTIDFQLVLYRVYPTHQVTVLSTDIRTSSDIALAYEGSTRPKDTRLLRLGINGTVITLRAVSHNAAVHWVEGLQKLKAGKTLQIKRDRATIESEDDIFEQIDRLTMEREWAMAPPIAPPAGLCGLCVPRSASPRKTLVAKPPLTRSAQDAHVGCRVS